MSWDTGFSAPIQRDASDIILRMVTITDEAKTELKKIYETRNLGPGRCLRLVTPPLWTGEGDFGLVIGSEGALDSIVMHEGIEVLHIDEALVKGLVKSVLDYKETPQGFGFALDVY